MRHGGGGVGDRDGVGVGQRHGCTLMQITSFLQDSAVDSSQRSDKPGKGTPQVSLEILIDGNLELKSLALAATLIATWRATAL